MPRTYKEEMEFIEKLTPNSWLIKKGFVPNMNVREHFSTLSHQFSSAVILTCMKLNSNLFSHKLHLHLVHLEDKNLT